ncbi:MAG: beta-ketoacyl synthase N-terminal-like domain-containing protein, partial [Caldilinea sp.]
MSNQREHRESASPAIAVVGVSALFPGSSDVRGFWRSILEGQDQIKEIPSNYWLIEDYYDPDPAAPDKTYGKRGAFLGEVPFDAMAYGVPPNVVQQTDTSQLLGLIVAQQVLEDAAGGDFQHLDKSRISVILGATGATELVVHLGSRLQRPIWLNALRANGIPEDEAQAICNRIADSYVPWTEASFPGLLGNVIAGRIANKFDLGGTNCVVDAACASSLSALAMGLSELHLHQADMVIVGGVDTLNDILMYMCFSKTPALSASGDCRPFSDQADGTILGEGLGMLALRRLEDAERDGDRIYAVIRGLGSSSDGKGTAVYAPKASGQAHALRRAYAVAGYSPRTVELLEAHGTATKAGDAAEFSGASSVFAEADPESKQWCAIGSVKSQIGHTKGAAGAASLIKAVLALHHKVLPPTIKVERPNPNLAVEESPFYINTQARPWVRDGSHPRRAGVSSFGFGGSNFHVTLEEYIGPAGHKDAFRPSPTELFLISRDTVPEIITAARHLTTGFDDTGGFQFLARSSQLTFESSHRLRLAIVARDFSDLRAKLDAAIKAIERDAAGAQQAPGGWFYSGDSTPARTNKLAFLFPGQGSQYVGMGADLALAFDQSRTVWDEAANLEFEQGGRLHEVVFPQPVFTEADRAAQETRLRATE